MVAPTDTLKFTLVVSWIFSDLIAEAIWPRFSAGGAAVAEVAALPVVLLSVALEPALLSAVPLLSVALEPALLSAVPLLSAAPLESAFLAASFFMPSLDSELMPFERSPFILLSWADFSPFAPA